MDTNLFDTESVDLARLVRHVVAERRNPFKHLSIVIQGPDTPVWVAADRPSLEHIIHSIIDDASLCTSQSGTIDLAIEPDPQACLAYLRVQVDGLGMEPSSSVEALVQLHGGLLDSTASDLRISLPLRQEAPAVASNTPTESPVGEHHRVLIIEDNRDGCETMQRLLECAGHEVKVAYTGPDGIRLADTWRPDFVLCDIGLPDLDGYHVADELRRKPHTSTAHLIAITGYGSPEDCERCRYHGFEQHFTKPADPEALLSLLGNA
jgi:two-component system CheB/CheR fusion protein